MKVKELIKDTVWLPGSEYDGSAKPRVSFLLPTFRRGESGLFRRAVRSVLDQTLTDIELIIVDDCSTDGTREQIEEFMAADGRVSCLRHQYNIGLPAVSEYEALMRARSDYIAFAFDDDFFYPDAMEKLLKESKARPHAVCYGYVHMRMREIESEFSVTTVTLGRQLSSLNLRSDNYLANVAVLLSRRVIDHVGFYDPHVMMSRIYDWDLWLRISEHYLLEYVDVAVGEVDGPATTDSMGWTYLYDYWSCSERMRRDRTKELLPQALQEMDVFRVPDGTIRANAAAIEEIAANHLARRPWLLEKQPEGAVSVESFGKTVLVVTEVHDAMVALSFDYLPSVEDVQVRVITVPAIFEVPELARASCLIVVRTLEPYRQWIDAAKSLGIPTYWFIDNCAAVRDMDAEDLGRKLQDFSGILSSSSAIDDYCREHCLHQNLFLFPPAYAGEMFSDGKLQNINPSQLTIAILDGAGRAGVLVPALRELASDGHFLHVVMSASSGISQEDLMQLQEETIVVTLLPQELDWKRAMLQLAQHAPDLVLVPASSENSEGARAFLDAWLLDAVLICPFVPPYGDSACIEEAFWTADQWRSAVRNAVVSRDNWSRIKEANARYCRENLSGSNNVALLRSILAVAPSIGLATVESRLKMLYLLKVSLSQELENRIAALRNLLDETNVRLDEIYNSRSWRITAPLRLASKKKHI